MTTMDSVLSKKSPKVTSTKTSSIATPKGDLNTPKKSSNTPKSGSTLRKKTVLSK